jgi:hypothetical protein
VSEARESIALERVGGGSEIHAVKLTRPSSCCKGCWRPGTLANTEPKETNVCFFS